MGVQGLVPDMINKITSIIGGMYSEIYMLMQHIRNRDR